MNDNLKKNILTIPNLLSCFRLLLIPIYAVLYMKAETLREYAVAAIVFAASALTDMVDGIIARKCHMISRLGIMLDPFADKMTQFVIILCLSIKKPAILPLLCLFVVKEAFMLIMACLHLKKRKMLDGALIPGKICTAVLFLSMFILVIVRDLPPVWVSVIVWICAIFMVISLVSYALCYFRRSSHIKDIEGKLL